VRCCDIPYHRSNIQQTNFEELQINNGKFVFTTRPFLLLIANMFFQLTIVALSLIDAYHMSLYNNQWLSKSVFGLCCLTCSQMDAKEFSQVNSILTSRNFFN